MTKTSTPAGTTYGYLPRKDITFDSQYAGLGDKVAAQRAADGTVRQAVDHYLRGKASSFRKVSAARAAEFVQDDAIYTALT
jgi:hypothetical protein